MRRDEATSSLYSTCKTISHGAVEMDEGHTEVIASHNVYTVYASRSSSGILYRSDSDGKDRSDSALLDALTVPEGFLS